MDLGYDASGGAAKARDPQRAAHVAFGQVSLLLHGVGELKDAVRMCGDFQADLGRLCAEAPRSKSLTPSSFSSSATA